MIGRILSHYRILGRIGEGGMGVVYKAEDEKLQRTVALKLLPPERLGDEERRLRFVREARTAAAVTHPNIAVVHEIDESGGVVFIAMELVEGKTLREVVGRKPLSLREALRLSVDIAEGLAAAHHHHVVHRDLKPENVNVTPDGRVKILDFGLAKLLEERSVSDSGEASRLATISEEMTQAGRVLGTASYMSPEQARGLPVDRRSDLFSFGTVLYEMVTGVCPFQGSTSMDTLTAILREEPVPPVQVNPEVPAELARIIGKCLEKDPGERYQDTRDLVVDLRRLKRDTDSQPFRRAEISAQSRPAPPKAGLARRSVVIAAVVVALLGLAVSVWGLLRRGRGAEGTAPPFQSMRMKRLASIDNLSSAALSSDGRFLAYVAREDGKYGLWVRQVSTGSDIQILPPQEATTRGLTFSPDGEHLYFLTRDAESPLYSALFEVPTLGGTPRRLFFDVDSAAAFSPDGRRIAFMRGGFESDEEFGIALILAHTDGTRERTLAFREYPPASFALTIAPSWSSDGKRIAAIMLVAAKTAVARIAEFDVADGKESRIGAEQWRSINALAWLPDRSGIVLSGTGSEDPASQIWFVAYPEGKARKITNDLNTYMGISVSADAKTLATVQVTTVAELWNAPVDDPGAARQITSGEGSRTWPGVNTNKYLWTGIAATPSGSLVFQTVRGGSNQIWGMAPDGANRRRLTPDGVEGFGPVVARLAGTIVFTGRGADRVNHVWKMDPDGGNPVQITQGDGEYTLDISPDGRWVVFWKWTEASLWKAPLDGGPPTKIIVPNLTTVGLAYSPDSRFLWISTVKEEGGRSLLGLERFPAEGGPPLGRIEWPRSCDTDFPFRLAPTGDALTCIGDLDGIHNLWSQPLAGGEAQPITRFKSGHVIDFDWSPDGKRLFLWRGEATTDIVLIKDFQ